MTHLCLFGGPLVLWLAPASPTAVLALLGLLLLVDLVRADFVQPGARLLPGSVEDDSHVRDGRSRLCGVLLQRSLEAGGKGGTVGRLTRK